MQLPRERTFNLTMRAQMKTITISLKRNLMMRMRMKKKKKTSWHWTNHLKVTLSPLLETKPLSLDMRFSIQVWALEEFWRLNQQPLTKLSKKTQTKLRWWFNLVCSMKNRQVAHHHIVKILKNLANLQRKMNQELLSRRNFLRIKLMRLRAQLRETLPRRC